MSRGRQIVGLVAAFGAILFLVIQVVPYGRNHANPPITGKPNWDSPATEQLARRACFDCHSNETQWPWYASVAPISWRVQRHVDKGRSKLNFSEFDRAQEEADEAAEVVQEGEMPLWNYKLMHAESRLTPGEKRALIDGLGATLGRKSEKRGHDQDDDD